MRIENVQVLMKDGVFRRASVEFDHQIQKIEVSDRPGSPAGDYLIPGLVDVHTHGALGGDHTDASLEDFEAISSFYARNGTTSFLATTLTDTTEVLEAAMRNLAVHDEAVTNYARCLGVNLEGPFFSFSKRGAHPAELLQIPSLTFFERLNELSGNRVKMVCIAPELEGAFAFIKEASKVCKVALAHSAADYETAMEGFASGASHTIHLFNGMSPFGHREPGIVGAALDSDVFVEVICDGYHLHPAVIRGIFRMFPGRVCLISDSIRCAGLPDGDYLSGCTPVRITNGKAVVKDGGSIAGSTISLLQGVRNAVSLGIPFAEAVQAASANGAKMLGMEDKIGSIAAGAYADLVLLDSDLQVKRVFVGGREIV